MQVAAAGVAAAAAVEMLRGDRRGRWHGLRHCLAGGGLALLYAHLVPDSAWGARSGAEFAQLLLVAGWRAGSRAEAAAWGAIAGGLMRASRLGAAN